jgi:GDP-L-fucose synthase
MNVGLGYDFTINEYYEVAASVMGYQGMFVYDTTKPVGMARKLVNIDRQLTWGWQSKSDLRSGLENTYKFYLEEYLQ